MDSFIIAFSILGRIVGAVTRGIKVQDLAKAVFQYPRTDRWCCDHSQARLRVYEQELSVSSDGSLVL